MNYSDSFLEIQMKIFFCLQNVAQSNLINSRIILQCGIISCFIILTVREMRKTWLISNLIIKFLKNFKCFDSFLLKFQRPQNVFANNYYSKVFVIHSESNVSNFKNSGFHQIFQKNTQRKIKQFSSINLLSFNCINISESIRFASMEYKFLYQSKCLSHKTRFRQRIRKQKLQIQTNEKKQEQQ